MLKIYLDNCCYGRPFDNQKDPAIREETRAKMFIQSLVKYKDTRIKIVNPIEFVKIWRAL
jgi:hypothetical protein